MSTHTDEDLVVLESLDFEPACEHSGHDKYGATGPAEWAILLCSFLECGCLSPTTLMLWCGDCKDRILSRELVLCPNGHEMTPDGSILRIEPL